MKSTGLEANARSMKSTDFKIERSLDEVNGVCGPGTTRDSPLAPCPTNVVSHTVHAYLEHKSVSSNPLTSSSVIERETVDTLLLLSYPVDFI